MTVKELYESLEILLNKGINTDVYIIDGNKYTSDFVLGVGDRNIYIEPTEKILDK